MLSLGILFLSLIQNLIKLHCLWKEQSEGHIRPQKSEQPEQRLQKHDNFCETLRIKHSIVFLEKKTRETKMDWIFIFIVRWFETWMHFFVGSVSLEWFQFTHQATLKSPRFCIILLDNKPKKPSVAVLIKLIKDENRIFTALHLSQSVLCRSSCAQSYSCCKLLDEIRHFLTCCTTKWGTFDYLSTVPSYYLFT